ncbi:hypothetical protein RPE78_09135 [Thioclava litoralis]|uniref:Uncharacterized protein n=1 Tax=Thioclava litoralis TaxID=3076557 RepID=A0ABZ1DVS8_9RHOB|nr:hypothetical protein RPE78_09135 [Thioclava sp. FTW29]
MGFAPSQIKEMTLWEYLACLDGWNRSQGKGHAHEGGPMTDADYDALCELGDMWNGNGSGSGS